MGGFAALIFIREAQSDGVTCLDLPFGFHVHIPYHEHSLQRWQFFVVPIEWILLGDLAVRKTLYRHRRWAQEAETPGLPMYNVTPNPSTAVFPVVGCIPEEDERVQK